MERERMIELAAKLLEGGLSSRQREELSLLLAADSELAKQLAEQAALDALLRLRAGEPKKGAAWNAVARRMRREGRWAAFARGLVPARRWALLPAAALLAAICWLGVSHWRSGLARQGTGQTALAVEAARGNGLGASGDSERVAAVLGRVKHLGGKLEVGGEVAAVNTELREDARLRALSLRGWTLLELARGGGQVKLGPQTEIILQVDDSGATVARLLSGEAEMLSAKGRDACVVATEMGRVAAAGARYWVRRVKSAAEKKALELGGVAGDVILVAVSDGTVELGNRSGRLTAEAGEVVWMAAGAIPCVLGASLDEDAR